MSRAEAVRLYNAEEQLLNYRHHRDLLHAVEELVGVGPYKVATETQQQFVYPYSFTVDYVIVDEVWYSLEATTFKAAITCPDCHREFCCYPHKVEQLGRMLAELDDHVCLRGWLRRLFHRHVMKTPGDWV